MQTNNIDPNHPWVEASTLGSPQPVPAQVRLEGVEITQEDKTADAILMTIIDVTGVKNVFMPPQVLEQILMQGAALLQGLNEKNQGGLIIADKNMEQVAKTMADNVRDLRRN